MSLQSIQDKFNNRKRKQKKRWPAFVMTPKTGLGVGTSGKNIRGTYSKHVRVGNMAGAV